MIQHNLALQPGDNRDHPVQNDLRVPQDRQTRSVRVEAK